jgi:lipocalin-like protein
MSLTPLRALTFSLLVGGCAPATPAADPGPLPPAAVSIRRSPLAGTWILTAADEIQPGGARIHSYGEEPKGLLMVDDSGRYSLQIFRTGRRRFASGDKRRGTPEEYVDAVLGMSSHTGRCFIDPADDMLVFQIELAAYPNWEGTVQRRAYTLSGEQLAYRIPVAASGNGTIPISEWRRVR